jgi:transglutaminase-like putative cysteine protease
VKILKLDAARFLCVLAGAVLLPAAILAADLPPGDRPAPDPVSRLEDAGTAEDHPGADHVIVLSEAVNKVKPTGVTYVDGYDLVKVLTAAGCRDQSVLNWRYDPQSSYVEVREVNLLRDGERLPVDVSQVHDLPAPQAAIYWRDRIKTLQLPRLEIGDGIEVITFRKGFTYALLASGQAGAAGSGDAPDDSRYIPPMPGEYFDIVRFAGDAPLLEKRYVLRLPADKRLHAEVYNGALYSSVTYDDQMTEYAWWGLDLPAQAHEPSQPDGSDFVPKVVMATAESWEAKSRWFFDVNQGQFEVTPAIQEKVDEILAEAGLAGADEEAKAKALLHWVAQNIRYSGQTMGEGEGFTLHSGEMIFDQRSGVCKDIAGMLITMMRAAGMDSYAAMTMAGSRIDAVPADQFNHCVTALRLKDGTFRMYDPTWVPYNNNIWSLLETEQHYLVGTPEGQTLSRIRYSPPEESPLKIKHQAGLDSDGTLSGSFRLEGSGAIDGRLRRMVAGTRKKDLEGRVARLLSALGPGVEKVKVKHHQPGDFSSDMWIEFSYRLVGFARPVAGGLEFTSPAMAMAVSDGSLFRGGSSSWPEERKTDVFLYFTQLVDLQESIKLPGGLKLAGTVPPETVDETYAAFSADLEQKGSELKINSRAEVRRRQIPPDGYPGFRAAMTAARDWAGQTIRVAKEGK